MYNSNVYYRLHNKTGQDLEFPAADQRAGTSLRDLLGDASALGENLMRATRRPEAQKTQAESEAAARTPPPSQAYVAPRAGVYVRAEADEASPLVAHVEGRNALKLCRSEDRDRIGKPGEWLEVFAPSGVRGFVDAGGLSAEAGASSPLEALTLPAGQMLVLDGEYLNTLNPRVLDHYQRTGEISLKALDLLKYQDYAVHNQTANRIGIRPCGAHTDEKFLHIPPFGSRVLNSEILKDYDFLDWKRQNLVAVEMVSAAANETAQLATGLLVILLVLFLLVGLPLAIFTSFMRWQTVGTGALVFLALIGASSFFSTNTVERGRLGSNLWEWLKLAPGIALVLLAGAGLPFGIVYFYGDLQQLLSRGSLELAMLGRLMQVAFISIAAILPALLYFLFGRLQIEKLRENFFREAMLLDPNVHSLSEARTKYDPLLESVYGAGNSPFAIVLLVISTALLVMGWVMALSPIGPADSTGGLIGFLTPRPAPIALGFMGAYFFSINMIFRRYVRSDLTPKTYAYATVRLLVTLVLVWAVSSLPQFASGTWLETGILVVAFVIGIFPETGLALIADYASRIVQLSKAARQNLEDKNAFPLTDLEGVNVYDRVRLLEEGIENVENLAHHNLMELIARTRIPPQRLVDMFDQAILYLHLGIGPEADGAEAAGPPPEAGEVQGRQLLEHLRSFGIRTASDLLYVVDNKPFQNGELDDVLPARRLRIIAGTIRGDGWINYVMNWYEMTNNPEPCVDPNRFYDVTQAGSSYLQAGRS